MTEARSNPEPATSRQPNVSGVVGRAPSGELRGRSATSIQAIPQAHVTSGLPKQVKSKNTLENLSLLIVDDDLPVLTACGKIAAGVGFDVYTAASASEARTQVINHSPDVVLMDLKMPAGGLSLLEEIRDKRPRSSIVVMTAFATVSSAVEAMRIGATDYLTKPFAMDELTRVLERAGERRSYELESKRIQGYLKGQRDSALIGTSPEIEKLHRIVQKVAPASHPVLILGEEGTGKEAVARAIHAGGAHATRPFSVLECGQLAPAVLEGELFGYVRSPNTGESRVKEGLLVAEAGGTLFLNGISEMPLDLQAKLLRALQEKKVRPAGSDQSIPVTVRVLAASSRNLTPLVDQGLFRKDLYYRLNIVSLRIPPLRERKQDVLVLAEYYLDQRRRGSAVAHRLGVDAIHVLLTYDWPGDVQELESTIDSACVKSSGPILHPIDLPSQLQSVVVAKEAQEVMRIDARETVPVPVGQAPVDRRAPAPIVSIADLEREAILHTIRQLHGDKLMAAKLLGIGKTTLYRKLKEYGIAE